MFNIGALVAPVTIIGSSMLVIVCIILYYLINSVCGCRGTVSDQVDSSYHPEILPPRYSDLSIRLPPTYSEGCKIVGYVRCEENYNGDYSSTSLHRSPSDLEDYSSNYTSGNVIFSLTSSNSAVTIHI